MQFPSLIPKKIGPKSVILTGLGTGAVLLGLLFVLPSWQDALLNTLITKFIDTQQLRYQIEHSLTPTGIRWKIRKLSLIPDFWNGMTVVMEDSTLQAPTGEALARLPQLTMHLNWFSLVTGRPRINTITLKRPSIWVNKQWQATHRGWWALKPFPPLGPSDPVPEDAQLTMTDAQWVLDAPQNDPWVGGLPAQQTIELKTLQATGVDVKNDRPLGLHMDGQLLGATPAPLLFDVLAKSGQGITPGHPITTKIRLGTERQPLWIEGQYTLDKGAGFLEAKARGQKLDLGKQPDWMTLGAKLGMTALGNNTGWIKQIGPLTGSIDAWVKVKGPVSKLVLQEADIALQQVSGSWKGMQAQTPVQRLSEWTGSVHYNGAQLTVPGLTGTYNQAPFRLKGWLNTTDAGKAVTVEASRIPVFGLYHLLHDVGQVLNAPILPDKLALGEGRFLTLNTQPQHLSGLLSVQGVLSQQKAKQSLPRFKGTVGLSNMLVQGVLDAPHVLPKRPAQALVISQLNGQARLDGNTVNLQDLRAQLFGGDLTVQGSLGLAQENSHLVVKGTNLPIGPLDGIAQLWLPSVAYQKPSGVLQKGTATMTGPLNSIVLDSLSAQVKDLAAEIPVEGSQATHQVKFGQVALSQTSGRPLMLQAEQGQFRLAGAKYPLNAQISVKGAIPDNGNAQLTVKTSPVQLLELQENLPASAGKLARASGTIDISGSLVNHQVLASVQAHHATGLWSPPEKTSGIQPVRFADWNGLATLKGQLDPATQKFLWRVVEAKQLQGQLATQWQGVPVTVSTRLSGDIYPNGRVERLHWTTDGSANAFAFKTRVEGQLAPDQLASFKSGKAIATQISAHNKLSWGLQATLTPSQNNAVLSPLLNPNPASPLPPVSVNINGQLNTDHLTAKATATSMSFQNGVKPSNPSSASSSLLPLTATVTADKIFTPHHRKWLANLALGDAERRNPETGTSTGLQNDGNLSNDALELSVLAPWLNPEVFAGMQGQLNGALQWHHSDEIPKALVGNTAATFYQPDQLAGSLSATGLSLPKLSLNPDVSNRVGADASSAGAKIALVSSLPWLPPRDLSKPPSSVTPVPEKPTLPPHFLPKTEAAFQGLRLTMENFKLPGSNLGLVADIDDPFKAPVLIPGSGPLKERLKERFTPQDGVLRLHNMNINGKQLNMGPLLAYLQAELPKKMAMLAPVPVKNGRDTAENDGPSPTAPNVANNGVILPFEFYGAQVHVAELIYQNILLTDVTGEMELHPDTTAIIRNAEAKSAGGTVKASITVNAKNPAIHQDEFVSVDMAVDHVQANALARALLNQPNQIFGNLTGKVQFTSRGQSDAELMRNSNGLISFAISRGRIPAKAKMEQLLSSANLVRGGLLGINLNNLVGSLKSFDSNEFARLKGDFQLANGNLYTQNLLSRSKNLELGIEGSIGLEKGMSDLLVNGAYQRDIRNGFFGRLGNLSIRRALHYVPVVGSGVSLKWNGLNLIPNVGGLIDYIPGVGFAPGFGKSLGKVNRFQVRIKGVMGDPKAVQGIRWL